MKADVSDFVLGCLVDDRVKTEHHKPRGLLQSLQIPVLKWEHITIDFFPRLPKTTKHHSRILVVVDKLTKTTHFLAIKITFTSKQLADLYI